MQRAFQIGIAIVLASVASFAQTPIGGIGGTGQTGTGTTPSEDAQPRPGPGFNPGDTVPGGTAPRAPSAPAPQGPGRPTTGSTPQAPAGPAGPQPSALRPPTITGLPDFTTWETWWEFNRDRFLAVRERLYTADPPTPAGATTRIVTSLRPDPIVVAYSVVPALLSILEQQSNPELLAEAIVALSRLEPPDAEALAGAAAWDVGFDRRLTAWLAHPTLAVSEAAVLGLGARGREENVRLLAALVDDAPLAREAVARDEVPYRSRAFAAYALGLSASRAQREDVRRYAVHELLRVLDEPRASNDLGIAVLQALSLVRVVLPPASLARADVPPSASREALVDALIARLDARDFPAGMRAHIPIVLARQTDVAQPSQREEELRLHALAAVLARAVDQDERSEVRQASTSALGRLARPTSSARDVDAVNALAALVRDSERSVRGFALIAAGEIAGRARGEDQRASAVRLQAILLGEFARGRSGAQGWAAIGLGLMGHGTSLLPVMEANGALRNALGASGSTSDLAATGLALGLRGDGVAEALLAQRVDREGDDRARGAHALALGLSGSNDSLAVLRSVFVQSRYRPLVLRDTAIALALLGDRNVALDLVGELQATRSLAVTAAACAALSTMGDGRTLVPLSQLVVDKSRSPTAKAMMVRALGAAADQDVLPWNEPYLRDVFYALPAETLWSSQGGGILDRR